MAKKQYTNYDDTLVGKYIRQLENPDSIGWDASTHTWNAPTLRGYDKRNRGMGVDILNNADAKNLTEGRSGRYLTEEEERQLRNEFISYAKDVIGRQKSVIPGLENMSPRKEAEVVGAIYRGDAKALWNPNTTIGKALRSDDEDDFHNAISEFYRSKNLNARADNNDLFWNQTTNNVPVEFPYKPLDTNSLENQKEKEMKSFIINNMKDQVHDFIQKANLQREINGTGGRWSEGGDLNSPWDGLSLQEKAEMMKVAVRNGIYNLNEIKQKYNEFAEGGKLSEDKEFNEWKESLPDNLRLTDERLYDLEGAYRAGMQPTLEDDGYYHLGSRDPQTGRILKTPMHPTYWQAIAEDAKLGYYPTIRNEETYTINEFKNGGDIYIKPSHKGRLTELKERTGKTEAELYNDGNPAHKKMVVFARNARKWHALGGNLYGTGGSWKQQHEQRWHDFLLSKGLAEADASRLAGFFTAQDGLESAGGKSSAARQKNNYGGMQKNGKNITYDSVNAYMEDKWRMMNSRFKPALSAQSIDEYATILGNPETAGKGYLYYVTDKAKYDPKSPQWKAAQIQHMHNYINGMRAWAGKGKVKFNDPVAPKPQVVEEVPYSTYVAPAPTAIPQFIPYNPEVFFGSTQPATPEPVFPIAEPVQETPVIDYEKQDKMDGIRRLGMVMGLLNNIQSTNPFDILTANYFDGTSQPTQQMNIMAYHPTEDYYTGPQTRLPEVTVTGEAPSWFGKKGLYPTRYRYNPKKTVASRTGQLTAGDAMKGIDAATGPLLHWAQPSQYVGAVRDAANGKNPLISMLRGNSGVTSEEYTQEHPYLSTLFNLGTDAFVLSGGPQRTVGVANNLRPQNLRNHVYVAKTPIGYDGIGEAVKRGIKNILSGKSADIDNPEWFNRESAEMLQSYAPKVEGLSEAEYADYLKNYGERALKARTDMWRLYNKIPQKYGTFTPSTRHPGAYTDIEGIESLKALPPQIPGESQIDFVNSVGGNVGKPTITNLGKGIPDAGYTGQNFGVTTTSDLWDLHPFSRSTDRIIPKYIKPAYTKYVGDPLRRTSKVIKNISDRLRFDNKEIDDYIAANKNDEYAMEMFDSDMFPSTGLKRKVGDLLYNASLKLNKTANTPEFSFLKPLEQKIADFEVGRLVGSKPVLVQYDIPWTANRKLTIGNDGMPHFTVEYEPGFHSNNIFPDEVMKYKSGTMHPWDASKDRTYNIFTNLIPR